MRRIFTHSSVGGLATTILYVSMACASDHSTSKSRSKTLRMSVQIERRQETNTYLKCEITNITRQPISIRYGRLPWERYAMTVAIVKFDKVATKVDQPLTFSHPAPKQPYILPPHETWRGEFLLERAHPDLRRSLLKEELLLFWSYAVAYDSPHEERNGGWLVIPRVASDRKTE